MIKRANVLTDAEIMVARVNPSKYLKDSEEFAILASAEERAIAQLSVQTLWERILDWHMEPCPHRACNAKYFKPSCACAKCWQILQSQLEE